MHKFEIGKLCHSSPVILIQIFLELICQFTRNRLQQFAYKAVPDLGKNNREKQFIEKTKFCIDMPKLKRAR